MDDISKKIRGLRIQKGLTLKELSEKTDLSVSFLSQVERGASSLAITSLKKIADALGVKMTYFLRLRKMSNMRCERRNNNLSDSKDPSRFIPVWLDSFPEELWNR